MTMEPSIAVPRNRKLNKAERYRLWGSDDISGNLREAAAKGKEPPAAGRRPPIGPRGAGLGGMGRTFPLPDQRLTEAGAAAYRFTRYHRVPPCLTMGRMFA